MVLLVFSYEHPRARLRRPAARPGGDLGDGAPGVASPRPPLLRAQSRGAGGGARAGVRVG